VLRNLLSFNGRYRILHLTWLAFFITFFNWFNIVAFADPIKADLGLSKMQWNAITTCNLALTIPARIIIGMLLDRIGPRKTFAVLLGYTIVPCLATAFAQDFNQIVIARLLMSLVGAGFVVGIRMVSEWFSAQEIGMAEGIYGGWGNAGAFASRFGLPLLAVSTAGLAGGSSNWRMAVAITGIIALIYSVIYYTQVQDTPAGTEYQRTKRAGSLEVTSVRGFWGLLASNLGLVAALGVLGWQLYRVKFLNETTLGITLIILTLLYAYQTYQAWEINRGLLQGEKRYSPAERYQFRQVALLELTYATNFGSELAIISMLSLFFQETFKLDFATASILAAGSSMMNLFTRPLGGIWSDHAKSRKSVMVIIMIGIGIGYLMMWAINDRWPLPLAIAATLFASAFAQAGAGATFAIAPLIKKQVTGQIAGNVGAYGNFGGVMYLAIFSLTNASILFEVMGIAALICAALCAFFLQEPVLGHGTEPPALAIEPLNSEPL
jgi:MFS transporter, NNP family, nitrate/nitrite transporter